MGRNYRRLGGSGGSRPPNPVPSRVGWFRRLFVWGLTACIWAVIAMVGLVAWYAYSLPDTGKIELITRRPNVTLLANDGSPLASIGGIYGEPVQLAELPPHLPRAVLAVEDRRFYEHFGVDPMGLLRAAFKNLTAGRVVQGGSTITQQLAKNLFLSPERTIKRKVQEILLAFWLEHRFTKDQILTIYLNRVYLGGGSYGVDAAARYYFDKPATQVTLYEAALLAGLLKAPSRLNPVRDPERAEARTALVINAMVQADYATMPEATLALQEKTATRQRAGGAAPYFSDWIMAQLQDFMGRIDQDLQVQTTLDPYLQGVAERSLAAKLDQVGSERRVSQGAIISMDPSGAVRAMVGGRSYEDSQFNRATQALRQPGSAFKPFVFLAGFESGGFEPDSRAIDEPVEIAGWAPKNYNDKYYGEVTLREAFARSLNSVSVRLTQSVGPRPVAEVARRMGITTPLEADGGLALGVSEVTLIDLTSAYAALADQGHAVWPYGIEEIRTADGEVFYRRDRDARPGVVVAPRDVEKLTDIMSAAVQWGSGKAANPNRPAAGKTGTSQEFRDAWFIGFTAELITGVWFGNDDNSPMQGVTGGSLPAQLWREVTVAGLDGYPIQDLPGGGSASDAGEDNFISQILESLRGGSAEKETSEEERLERYFQPKNQGR
ncbi:MAG: PBP1A family penicillin-binding protein [Pseudomonadota bacterium]